MSFYAPFHINKTVPDLNNISTIYFNCSDRRCRATAIAKIHHLIPNHYSITLKKSHSCGVSEDQPQPIEVVPHSILEGIVKEELRKRDFNNPGNQSKFSLIKRLLKKQ